MIILCKKLGFLRNIWSVKWRWKRGRNEMAKGVHIFSICKNLMSLSNLLNCLTFSSFFLLMPKCLESWSFFCCWKTSLFNLEIIKLIVWSSGTHNYVSSCQSSSSTCSAISKSPKCSLNQWSRKSIFLLSLWKHPTLIRKWEKLCGGRVKHQETIG